MIKRYGFTLLEVLVVLFIFVLIFLAIFVVAQLGRDTWYTGSSRIELQQQTRMAMDWMVKELRKSGSGHTTIGAGGVSITFQIPVDWDNDADVLDGQGNIEWGAEDNLGWAIEYRLGGLNNRQLLKRVLNAYPGGTAVGTDVTLANNIRSDTPPPNALMFTSTSPAVIEIEVTAERLAISGRTVQSTLNGQVNLRN